MSKKSTISIGSAWKRNPLLSLEIEYPFSLAAAATPEGSELDILKSNFAYLSESSLSEDGNLIDPPPDVVTCRLKTVPHHH